MTGIALSPRARKRVNARLLDALTWFVLIVMLAMLVWVGIWYATFRRDFAEANA